MPPQQHDPNGESWPGYIRVPVTAIKTGSIILWSGIACPVEAVTPIGSQHTCINYRYDGKVRTGTFENKQQIHVKREQGSEPTP